jgi:hypothetical protein
MSVPEVPNQRLTDGQHAVVDTLNERRSDVGVPIVSAIDGRSGSGKTSVSLLCETS